MFDNACTVRLAFDAITAFRIRDLSLLAIADFVVLTAGLAGFHPSKRQPLPGAQKFREGARFLSSAVVGIRARDDWNGKNPEKHGGRGDRLTH